MIRPLTVVVLVFSLALPVTASAWEAPGQAPAPAAVTAVVRLAEGYWDRVGVPAPAACADGVKVWVAPDLAASDNVTAAGRGDAATCEIWLLGSMADALARDDSFMELAWACGALVHEVGHARGLQHTATGVMSIAQPPVDFAWTPAFCISWARSSVLVPMRAGEWARQIAREIRTVLAPRRRYLAQARH